MSDEERLRRGREWVARQRAQETPDEREARLKHRSEYMKNRRAQEIPEEREERLQQRREYKARKKAEETPAEREERLRKDRESFAKYFAQETIPSKLSVNCPCCQLSMKSRDLIKHLRRYHKDEYDGWEFSCGICSAGFTREKDLVGHQAKNPGPHEYP